ncbi:MAG: fatty acid desaturase [Spirochaetales bacterium]
MATANTISWYRTPIDKETLRELTTKSDLRGLLHAGSFLLLFLGTLALPVYFFFQEQWVWMVVTAYVHCMFHGFVGMGAAVHELSHQTAFKTKWLNNFFYKLFAFFTWNSHFHFKESHTRHHMNTGFMELDKEIQPEPIGFKKSHVIGWFLFDWAHFKKIMWTNLNHAFGNTDVDFFFWCPLLSKENIKTKKLISWARFLFIGHGILLALFIVFELWILIPTFTFGYFFATFLVHGCEVQQHAGLSRDVPDWRVIAYTAKFGPIMSFLYWNMNYHAEHHMYASVPFYNLPKLHKVLEPDLPKPITGYARGLIHVLRCKKQQNADPDYRFMPEFPETANPPKMA